MGKSKTILVSVSPKKSSLSILVHPKSGPPGSVSVTGRLTSNGSPVGGKKVTLVINGLDYGSEVTYDLYGEYGFYGILVDAGVYNFQTIFDGDDEYAAAYSPLAIGTYSKVASSLTISVSPTSGAPPLDVSISGKLKRGDTGAGIGGRAVDLYRSGSLIDSTSTSIDPKTLGQYAFDDVLNNLGTYPYYVYFEGDDQFEGCEKHDGTVVTEEEPTPDGLGLLLLLGLWVVSQE